MTDFSQALHRACVSFSTVIEFNVWLWNQIRIVDYFPALLLHKTKYGKLEQDRGTRNCRVGFEGFCECSNLRFSWPVVLKLYQTFEDWNDAATELELAP